jgi:hypothetical protein
MKHLTIRGVPPNLARGLESEARDRGQSLNQTVKDLLAKALGIECTFDNGLGSLAGGWSDKELHEFEAATGLFEQVDEEMWK